MGLLELGVSSTRLIMKRKLDRKESSSNGFSNEDNSRIIALVKAKIRPMHRKPNMFPRRDHMSLTTPNFYTGKKRELDIIDRKELMPFELLSRNLPIDLVSRARAYIEEKKKVISEEDYAKPTVDLSLYMRMLDTKNEDSENQMMKEFLKMKKESASVMSKADKRGTQKKIYSEDFNFVQKSEEECSLINAKIRQRLNHRKIISLYRYG